MSEPKEMTELQELAAPLVKWLQENYDPYTFITIENNRITLSNQIMGIPFEVKVN